MGKTYTTFADWAAAPTEARLWVAELPVVNLSTGATTTIYLATAGGVWDGSHYYEPYLLEIPRLTQRAQILQGNGGSLLAYGEIVVGVVAGAEVAVSGLTMDDLLALAGGYSFAGQTGTLRFGGPALPFAEWATSQVLLQDASYNRAQMTIPVKSLAGAVLDLQVPPRAYGNNNFAAFQTDHVYALGELISTGSDDHYQECTTAGTSAGSAPAWATSDGSTTASGTATFTCRSLPASTVGKEIPVRLGRLYNVAPVLISENPWIYHISDDQVAALDTISATYLDGKTASPAATNAAGCWVKFTSQPTGQVTCDLKGAKLGGAYSETVAGLFSGMLQALGGVDAGDIDSAAVSAHESAFAYPVGISLDSKGSLAAALDTLVNGLLTVWWATRAGKFTLALLTPPAGTADIELAGLDMYDDLAVAPDPRLLWRATVRGNRNWSVNGNPDATLDADRQEWLKQDYRSGDASDDAVQTLFGAAAQDETFDSCLALQADLATVAAMHMALWGQRRQVVTWTARLQPMATELLDLVSLSSSRFGMSAGALGRLVGYTEQHMDLSSVTLEVWL